MKFKCLNCNFSRMLFNAIPREEHILDCTKHNTWKEWEDNCKSYIPKNNYINKFRKYKIKKILND